MTPTPYEIARKIIDTDYKNTEENNDLLDEAYYHIHHLGARASVRFFDELIATFATSTLTAETRLNKEREDWKAEEKEYGIKIDKLKVDIDNQTKRAEFARERETQKDTALREMQEGHNECTDELIAEHKHEMKSWKKEVKRLERLLAHHAISYK